MHRLYYLIEKMKQNLSVVSELKRRHYSCEILFFIISRNVSSDQTFDFVTAVREPLFLMPSGHLPQKTSYVLK